MKHALFDATMAPCACVAFSAVILVLGGGAANEKGDADDEKSGEAHLGGGW